VIGGSMTAEMTRGSGAEPPAERPLRRRGGAGSVGDAGRSAVPPSGDRVGIHGQDSAVRREDPGDLHRMTLRLLLRV